MIRVYGDLLNVMTYMRFPVCTLGNVPVYLNVQVHVSFGAFLA